MYSAKRVASILIFIIVALTNLGSTIAASEPANMAMVTSSNDTLSKTQFDHQNVTNYLTAAASINMATRPADTLRESQLTLSMGIRTSMKGQATCLR